MFVLSLLIYVLCFLANVPGMINGNNVNFLAGGVCLGIMISALINRNKI